MTHLWLLGDQLGPHFDDGSMPSVLVESRVMFRRRRYHRQKAHLILTAMRMRAQEQGCALFHAETFAQGIAEIGEPVEVWHPHSRAAERVARSVGAHIRSATPGFLTTWDEFTAWVRGRGSSRLLLEDWYRHTRREHRILMNGEDPVGGRWNFDEMNREPPPRGRTRLLDSPPWLPVETEIDAEVRDHLDRWEREGIEFIGRDGPRQFAASRREALEVLDHFITYRLPDFGPYEDAMMAGDPYMAHSLLSAPMNLGLLSPGEVVDAASRAYHAGTAPLHSVEGFIRQVIGWREYVWHLYWHLGERYVDENHLDAQTPPPRWLEELEAGAVSAACLADVLSGVAERGWVHHIPRLMVLANWALQRGYQPHAMNDWFQRAFVDGYPWVMAANVVGMGLFADGGIVATKPYAAGGAYINKMSNYCAGCRYSPTVRIGDDACPFTAGYWWFLDRTQDRLAGNHRMSRALAGLRARTDIEEIRVQETSRADGPP
jgi:deoxyribodipyrimidine photolyase-related protein